MGNKCDLAEKRAVTSEEVQFFLEKHREMEYIETSAKTAAHIEEAFHKIANMLVDCHNKNMAKDPKARRGDNKVGGTETTTAEGE